MNSYSPETLNWKLCLTMTLNYGWQHSKENYHVYITLNFLHAFVYRVWEIS